MASRDGDPAATRRLADQVRRTEDVTGVQLRMHQLGGSVPPGFEARAVDSGDLAALVPDGFASVDAAGGLARSGRPLLDALLADGARIDMPAEGTAITFVASTTLSVSASTTTAENVAVHTQDPVLTDAEVSVETIAASVTVSRQVLDRSDVDQFLNVELRRALDQEQELRLVQGLLESATTVACNTASQRDVARCTLQAARVASDQRNAPVRVIAWHPRRWWWLHASELDTASSRYAQVMANLAASGPVRHVFSHQLVQTSQAGQDVIFTLAGDSLRYGEEPARVTVTAGEHSGSGTVRFTAYRYVAWTPLYTAQVAAVSGSGLNSPAAFA